MSDIKGLRDKYSTRDGERFFKELYDKEEYLSVLDKPLTTVLDVGALAGEFCAYIYDKAGVIYALEPFSPHYKELYDNVKEFHLDKIKAYRLALADYNGEGKLTTHEARGGNHLTTDNRQDEEIVQVKTLATFMKEEGIEHINVLKIDIEGNELMVFGSKDFDEVASKIDCIIGEHLGGVTDRLNSLGFKQKPDRHGNTIFERL